MSSIFNGFFNYFFKKFSENQNKKDAPVIITRNVLDCFLFYDIFIFKYYSSHCKAMFTKSQILVFTCEM